MRRSWLSVVLIAGLAVSLALRPPGAQAHAALQRSVPADRARLATAPTQVDLYFGQQVVQGQNATFVAVLDQSGKAASGEARVDVHDGAHVVAPLQGGLDAGPYLVFWKSTSDEDGGVTVGQFSFFVGNVDDQTIQQTPAGGQVLIPEAEQRRILSAPARGSGAASYAVPAGLVGAACGALLGGAAVYLAGRRREQRRASSGGGPLPSRRR